LNIHAQYVDGTYLEKRPDWFSADSPWKARKIAEIIADNGLRPTTVCEVGCGAGEVLRELSKSFPTALFDGYEVSPQAYKLCQQRASERVRFHLADLLQCEVTFDLLLVIDVFEHLEDYFAFLVQLRSKARQMIFHIPLDLSASALIRPKALVRARQSIGHLHYFTRETALAALEDAGYRVIDHRLTRGALELGKGGLRTRVGNVPRRILRLLVGDDMTQRLLGGYSVLALADANSGCGVDQPKATVTGGASQA
jgi:2-polyprenyl-3-methyl-5-hydroxy-6-metoxy-1,4-benzoquinol methylase